MALKIWEFLGRAVIFFSLRDVTLAAIRARHG